MKKIIFFAALLLSDFLQAQVLNVDIESVHLTFDIDEQEASLIGMVNYKLKALEAGNQIKLKLYTQLTVDSVVSSNQNKLNFKHESVDLMINFDGIVNKSAALEFTIFYRGFPLKAKLPPWQGGWVVKKDTKGDPWITVACQQEGAQIWWPAFEDKCLKPQKTNITGIHNSKFQFVANGNLISKEKLNGIKTKSTFQVVNPVSSYNISFGLGNYVLQTDTLVYQSGNKLPIHVQVLNVDSLKSREYLIPAIKNMLGAYEKSLGEYPFMADGYGIIQTPFAGMEHQSGIAYGNKFKFGYLGEDFAGLDLPFDFIVVHESGHEWFGNLISTRKTEDFWINEGFCTYAEKLFVKSEFGDSIAVKYLWQKAELILNKNPIISNVDVFDTDRYYKAALVIHSIETMIDDETWWNEILKQFIQQFRGQCVTSQEVILFFKQFSNSSFQFDEILREYLLETAIPVWEYSLVEKKGKLILRHRLVSKRKIQLPIALLVKETSKKTIVAKAEWQTVNLGQLTDSQVTIFQYGVLCNHKRVR